MTSINQEDKVSTQVKSAIPKRRLRLTALGLRVSERKLLLALVDIFLLAFALYLAIRFRTELSVDIPSVFLNAKWFITLAVL